MSVDPTILEQVRLAEQEELRKLRAAREHRRKSVPPEALRWLALAPLWTVDLAEAAGFPAGGEPAAELLERVHELGLCEREISGPRTVLEGTRRRRADGKPVYWASRRQRRQVIEPAIEADGVEALARELGMIAQRVLGADPPPRTRRWAQVAAASPDEERMTADLTKQVVPLIEKGSFGDARRWVEAVRDMPLPFAATFSPAVDEVARRIELEHRRGDDRRRLHDFLAREEQTAAFRALLYEPAGWALHYVGFGGVGKTTLLRHVTVQLAQQEGVATAGIDFDFLTADYPLTRPIELLSQFALALRIRDTSALARSEFASFEDSVRVLNEQLDARSGAAPFPAAALPRRAAAAGLTPTAAIAGEDALREIIEAFALGLEALDQRVVLLLDTCEELARLRPDGTAPASVEVTFDILERLHARIPSLRVVFCGRRPLASRGTNWSAVASRLAVRPYLRLHEIRGFDRDGAERFLAAARVPEELRPHILERTGAVDETVRFQYDGPGDGPVIGIKRYNPFELALYSRWAKDADNPPTVDEIKDPESDPYVAARLVGPLQDEVLRGLAHIVATLGRFDYEVMRAVSGLAPDRFDDAFRWLVESEWIDAQSGGWYEVQRALRPRIRRYLESSGPDEVPTRQRELKKRLEEYIDDCPLDGLDQSHLAAMVRLLGDDPAAAWTWWSRIEQRFVGRRDWVRAQELTGLLLAAYDREGAEDLTVAMADPLPETVAGYVRATYAAALAQVSPAADAATEWAAVEAWVDQHPDARGAAVLRLRSRAGAIAATPARLARIGRDTIVRLLETVRALPPGELNEALAAAVIAAIEVIVEQPRREGEALPVCTELLEAVLGAELSPPLEAFTRSLHARVRLRSGRPEEAWDEFERAFALQWPRATRPSWMDWRAPDDIGSRIRLELSAAGFEPGRALDAIGPTSAVPRSTLEGRWLRSAIVMLELFRVWKPLESFPDAEATTVIDEPLVKVHTVLPPLSLTAGYASAAAGCPEDALCSLASTRRRAEREGALLAVQWADLLTLDLHARMRLRDDRLGAATIGRQAASLLEQALLWRLDGLDGAKATSLFAPSRASERPSHGQEWPSWRHARWRALYTHTPERGRDAVAWAALALAHERHAPSREHVPVLACALDALEANIVSDRLGMPHPCRQTFEVSDVERALGAAARGSPAAAFELLLRCCVLTGDQRAAGALPELAQRIGARRAGMIALTETELLALRLPDRAVDMLEHAVEWLSAARDPVNLFLATALGALTLLRARDDERARVWIDRLEGRYRELDGLPRTGLPRWERLVAIASNPNGERLETLGPLVWRPWLVRVGALLAWRRASGERDLAPIARWITQRYGLQGPAITTTPELAESTDAAPAAIPVPAELEGWLGDTEQLWVARAGRPKAGEVAERSALAAVALAVWVACAFAIGSFAGQFDDLGSLVLVAGLVLAVVSMFTLSWRRLTQRSTVLVDVMPSEPSTSAAPVSRGRYAIRLTGAGPPFFNRHLPSAVNKMRVAAVATIPPRVRGGDAPPELEPLRTTFRRLATTLRGGRLDVAMVISPGAAWVPWEALLVFDDSGKVRSPQSIPLRFRRVPVRARAPVARHPHPRHVVTLGAGLLETDLARAWKEAKPRRHETHRIEDAISLEPDWDVDVLHVAGHLRATEAGVRLEAGDSLLRSADIAARFPALELCVLQSPAVARSWLTSRERDQAALLRSFASELAEHGIPAVMTIPPLQHERAREALAAVAGHLGANVRADNRRLQRAMRDAQMAIAPARQPAAEDVELALQTCLYVAGDLAWVYRLLGLVAFEPIFVSRISGEVGDAARREAKRSVPQ